MPSVSETPAPAAWVGIDISKDTLDACLLPAPGGKPRTQAFANDPAGHAALAAWADEHAAGTPLGFCLESTGAYSEALATAVSAKCDVVIVDAPPALMGTMKGALEIAHLVLVPVKPKKRSLMRCPCRRRATTACRPKNSA